MEKNEQINNYYSVKQQTTAICSIVSKSNIQRETNFFFNKNVETKYKTYFHVVATL